MYGFNVFVSIVCVIVLFIPLVSPVYYHKQSLFLVKDYRVSEPVNIVCIIVLFIPQVSPVYYHEWCLVLCCEG